MFYIQVQLVLTLKNVFLLWLNSRPASRWIAVLLMWKPAPVTTTMTNLMVGNFRLMSRKAKVKTVVWISGVRGAWGCGCEVHVELFWYLVRNSFVFIPLHGCRLCSCFLTLLFCFLTRGWWIGVWISISYSLLLFSSPLISLSWLNIIQPSCSQFPLNEVKKKKIQHEGALLWVPSLFNLICDYTVVLSHACYITTSKY